MMKSLTLSITALMLLTSLASAETTTCIDLSAPAMDSSQATIRLKRHIQGQFERLTANSSQSKPATIDAQFQADPDGHPVNITIPQANYEPEIAKAALAAIRAKSLYLEPMQCYRITFSYRPTPQAVEVAVIPTPQTTKVRSFIIDNDSLMPSRPEKLQTNTNMPHAASPSPPAPHETKPATAPSKPSAASASPATDINAYYAEVNQRIHKNLARSGAVRDKKAVIQFIIATDGHLADLSVVKSSGSDTADQAALSAIKACAPFRHLPTDCKLAELKVQLTL